MQSPDEPDATQALLIRANDAWRAVRDTPREGSALARAVAAEAGTANDWPALVVALRARAWGEREVFDYPAARATLARAVRIARREALPDLLALVLATRASVQLETGRVHLARADIARARAALQGLPSADVDLQAAVVEDACGRVMPAVARYRAMLRDHPELPPEIAFTVHNNLGVLLGQTGAVLEARSHLGQAEAVARTLGRSTLGFAVHNQAVLAARTGQVATALRRFDEAEGVFRSIGFPLAEHFMERIEVFLTLNLLAEAEQAAKRAVSELAAVGGELLIGETRLALARVRLGQGDAETAEQLAGVAEISLRRARGALWAAQAELVRVDARMRRGAGDGRDLRRLMAAGSTLDSAGFVQEATDTHLLAGRLAVRLERREVARREFAAAAETRRSPLTMVRLRAWLARALVARLEDDRGAQLRAARAGVREFERLRGTVPTPDLHARAAVHGTESAELGLSAALVSKRPWRVLEWAELGRRAALPAAPGPLVPDGADADRAELREVVARLRSADRADHMELAALLRRQRSLEQAIQRAAQRGGASVAVAPGHLGRAGLIELLGGRVMVSFAQVDGMLAAVTVARGRARLHDLAPVARVREETDALRFALRRLAGGSDGPSAEVAEAAMTHPMAALGKLLIAPLTNVLADAGDVVVVPTAGLFPLPWHALPGLDGRRVSVAPSAGLWATACGRGAQDGRVVSIAGPGLPGAAAEAVEVARLHPGASASTPPCSTVDEALGLLGTVAIAHIACHGTLRSDNPDFSSLELSDGPLTLLDLERLGKVPGTVVLSACEVGGAHGRPGTDVRGFVSVLLQLGARAVVASPGLVSDRDASRLMLDFHRGVAAGTDVGEALRSARSQAARRGAGSGLAALAFTHFGA